MSDPAGTAIAVLAALAAAGSFGVAAAVQLAAGMAAIAGITLLGRYAGTTAIRYSTNQDHLVTGARAACQGRPASCADRRRPALEGKSLR